MINKDLFDEIDINLGEITDFKISEIDESLNKINYKSNGINKEILLSDKSNKILLQCFLYCGEHFKRYSHLATCLLSLLFYHNPHL